MRYLVVMCLASTLLFNSCAARRPPPAPVIGVDIADVKKDAPVPFDGTLFSPAYLNDFLQWKADTQ